jgi:hypothetical protein
LSQSSSSLSSIITPFLYDRSNKCNWT